MAFLSDTLLHNELQKDLDTNSFGCYSESFTVWISVDAAHWQKLY